METEAVYRPRFYVAQIGMCLGRYPACRTKRNDCSWNGSHMIVNPIGRRREPIASDTKARISVYAKLDREFGVRRILLSKVRTRMWEVVDDVLLVAEVEVRRRGFRDIENDIICSGEVDESTSHRSVLDSRLQRICSKSASDEKALINHRQGTDRKARLTKTVTGRFFEERNK